MSGSSACIPLAELRELKTLTRSQITRLEAINTDGTGLLKAEDILQVLENDRRRESQKVFFNKLILLLMVSGVVLIGALCGITYGIVATTNELNVDNDDHILKTSASGGAAGVGAVVSSSSAESVLSSTEPWGITRINFVDEKSGEYGFIAINAIQVIENDTALVRSVLGAEYLLDESGGLVVHSKTNNRKLLFYFPPERDAISTAIVAFGDAVIAPAANWLFNTSLQIIGGAINLLDYATDPTSVPCPDGKGKCNACLPPICYKWAITSN